jgi:hypothetical protein
VRGVLKRGLDLVKELGSGLSGMEEEIEDWLSE